MTDVSFIVITGDPVDGFTFYGQFDTHEDAVEWAEFELRGITWWIANIYKEIQ